MASARSRDAPARLAKPRSEVDGGGVQSEIAAALLDEPGLGRAELGRDAGCFENAVAERRRRDR